MSPRIDWRKPIIARAEEMTATVDGALDEHDARRERQAIRWHLGEEAFDRVKRLEACYNCLTCFPARPMKMFMPLWVEAEKAGFQQVKPKAIAHRLIREERCPICGVPISNEAVAYGNEGANPLNDRSDDE